MAKVKEITIKTFHTILKADLPLHAPVGRPILITDTMEMYVGTGDTTPLLRLAEVMVVNSFSNLTLAIGTTLKIYITKDTNEKYFFHNDQYFKIHGLGILSILEKYSDLPISNDIEGFFAIKKDETNNNLSTIYFYNKQLNSYKRISYVDVQNTFLNINVEDEDMLATGANNIMKINSGNLMNLISDQTNKTITIEQKAELNIEMEMKTYQIHGGVKASLPVTLDLGNMAVSNNKIYLLNGRIQSTGASLNTIYNYDDINGWVLLATKTPFTKSAMCTHAYKDKIYLSGGFNCVGTNAYYSYNNFYEFDPLTNIFTELTPSTKKGHSIHSAIIEDKLWLLGGGYYASTSSSSYTAAPTVDYYDFITEKWTVLGSAYNMPTPTDGGATFVIGSKIHCVGGYNRATKLYTNIHQVFDTETLTWSTKASYPYSYYGMQGMGVNQLGYVMGGHPDGYSSSNTCYVYLSTTDTWIQRQNMPSTRTNTKAVFFNGSIYTIGGGYYYNNSGYSYYNMISSVEAYGVVFDTEIKDYEIVLRSPQKIGVTTAVSNLINNVNAEVSRHTTLENGEYWEYGDWSTTGQVEVLVKRFNY